MSKGGCGDDGGGDAAGGGGGDVGAGRAVEILLVLVVVVVVVVVAVVVLVVKICFVQHGTWIVSMRNSSISSSLGGSSKPTVTGTDRPKRLRHVSQNLLPNRPLDGRRFLSSHFTNSLTVLPCWSLADVKVESGTWSMRPSMALSTRSSESRRSQCLVFFAG